MRTNRTKEEFIIAMKKEIAERNKLQKLYNKVVLPTLEKFNGKVLNIRLKNAIQEKLPPLFYVKEEGRMIGGVEFSLNRRNDTNYYDMASLYFIVVCDDERINFEKSKDDEQTRKIMLSFNAETSEIKMGISQYNAYMKKAEKLEAMIKDFNLMPYCLRSEFNKNDFWVAL